MGRLSKRALKNKEAKTRSRDNESFRVQELENEKLRKQFYHASQDITNQRKILNLKCTKKRLLDPVNKLKNQITSRKTMLKHLQDPVNKKKHQITCRKNMDIWLQDPVNKKKNQITSRKSMDKQLQDPVNKLKNQITSRKSMLNKKKTRLPVK